MSESVNPIAWVDLETGGTDHRLHQITQIAAIATTGGIELEEIGSPFERKVTLTKGRYTKEALEIQGYDRDVWVEEAVPMDHALREFRDWLEPHGHTRTGAKGKKYDAVDMAGHNCRFDADFLRASADRNKLWLPIANWTGGMYDTLQLAKWVCLLEGLEPPNYKLETLCKFFGLPSFGAHDALEDVRACIKLARCLLMGF
jgi:DNA polymerase III epsilon subunit-like protein